MKYRTPTLSASLLYCLVLQIPKNWRFLLWAWRIMIDFPVIVTGELKATKDTFDFGYRQSRHPRGSVAISKHQKKVVLTTAMNRKQRWMKSQNRLPPKISHHSAFGNIQVSFLLRLGGLICRILEQSLVHTYTHKISYLRIDVPPGRKLKIIVPGCCWINVKLFQMMKLYSCEVQ